MLVRGGDFWKGKDVGPDDGMGCGSTDGEMWVQMTDEVWVQVCESGCVGPSVDVGPQDDNVGPAGWAWRGMETAGEEIKVTRWLCLLDRPQRGMDAAKTSKG